MVRRDSAGGSLSSNHGCEFAPNLKFKINQRTAFGNVNRRNVVGAVAALHC
jgi:hypothetical protein